MGPQLPTTHLSANYPFLPTVSPLSIGVSNTESAARERERVWNSQICRNLNAKASCTKIIILAWNLITKEWAFNYLILLPKQPTRRTTFIAIINTI